MVMASNQYRQQWQQGPTPAQPQYQYDRRDDQRQWQEQGRAQGGYNQDYQRYNEHPKNHNGYGPGPGPTPVSYDQNEQWQGQNPYAQGGYQENYSSEGNGYPNGHSRDQYDTSNRNYQYDDRYRSNSGPTKPPTQQNSFGHSNGGAPPRNQRSEPSTPKQRSKREANFPFCGT